MDKSRLEIKPGIWLDHRRALFLEESRTLCVADLHLGYAWAHRYSGQMIPVKPGTETADQLCGLCEFYKPDSLVILGDIIHYAAPVQEMATELTSTFAAIRRRCDLRLILGNHDTKLRHMLPDEAEFHDCLRIGKHLLVHGHEECPRENASLVIMGHEHPAIFLGDNVRAAKFPCFLIGEGIIVLPAFSPWAAGSDVRGASLSPIIKNASPRSAVAILDNKLLVVPL